MTSLVQLQVSVLSHQSLARPADQIGVAEWCEGLFDVPPTEQVW